MKSTAALWVPYLTSYACSPHRNIDISMSNKVDLYKRVCDLVFLIYLCAALGDGRAHVSRRHRELRVPACAAVSTGGPCSVCQDEKGCAGED